MFSINGRGTVVTGQVGGGIYRSGDIVTLIGAAGEITAVSALLDVGWRTSEVANVGEQVGILLRDVERNRVHRGDLLFGK